jgi:hypothetical protein
LELGEPDSLTVYQQYRADAELGRLLREALATVQQGHGLLVYPDNKTAPVGVVTWNGLFAYERSDATRALAAHFAASALTARARDPHQTEGA